MTALTIVNHALAAIVGLVTAVVCWRIMRQYLGVSSPVLGTCVGLLSGIGLLSHKGGSMFELLIPYEALGISIVVMIFLLPFLKVKSGKPQKPSSPEQQGKSEKPRKPSSPERQVKSDLPDDPWEREIRRGGKMTTQFTAKERK